jgi:hypothetical protein
VEQKKLELEEGTKETKRKIMRIYREKERNRE